MQTDAATANRAATIEVKPFLSNMQLVRLLAAMMVLVSHLDREIRSEGLTDGWTALIDRSGIPWSCGVDLFFAVSGFLMLYLTWDKFTVKGYGTEFLKRRFIRVVPLYWLMTAAFVVVTLASPHAIRHNSLSLQHVMTSFLFIPWNPSVDNAYPVLILGWTLNYEIMFYLVFAMSLANPRKVAVPMIAAAFVTLSALNLYFTPTFSTLAFWTDPIILEFLFGMVICILYMKPVRLGIPSRVALVTIGFIALVVMTKTGLADTETQRSWLPRSLWAGIPCACIMSGFILGEQASMRSWLVRLLVLGGDASYSLYLTHMFSSRALTIIWRDLRIDSGWSLLLVGLVVAPAVAIAVFLYIETPLLSLLRKVFEPRRPRYIARA